MTLNDWTVLVALPYALFIAALVVGNWRDKNPQNPIVIWSNIWFVWTREEAMQKCPKYCAKVVWKELRNRPGTEAGQMSLKEFQKWWMERDK